VGDDGHSVKRVDVSVYEGYAVIAQAVQTLGPELASKPPPNWEAALPLAPSSSLPLSCMFSSSGSPAAHEEDGEWSAVVDSSRLRSRGDWHRSSAPARVRVESTL
jgi:hypothetical protein